MSGRTKFIRNKPKFQNDKMTRLCATITKSSSSVMMYLFVVICCCATLTYTNAQVITTNASILSTTTTTTPSASSSSSSSSSSSTSSSSPPPSTLSSSKFVSTTPLTVVTSSGASRQQQIEEAAEANNNVTNNATRPAKKLLIDQMLPDFMPDYIRNNGGVIVHILLLAYVCLALGIVCDIYFLSSLEFISNSLKIPSNIAGATFMAIGTSAPELFTSLIGVFISEDDIGTGTILGSAVFNIIFVSGMCGFAVYQWCETVPKVNKFVILRDTIFYMVTITTLLLALKDNEIDWVESLVMIGLFVIYLIIMYFNAQVSDLVYQQMSENNETTPLLNSQNSGQTSGKGSDIDWENEKSRTGISGGGRVRYASVTDEGEPDEDNWIESNRVVKYVMFPAILFFRITLPRPTKYCFIITFIISIVWISLLTYSAVWLVTIIGYTLSVPETVSGLTLLAAGTSIPELISSVLVVKRAGFADMALCNSIGSNIFDILIGLGFPWLLKSIFNMFDYGTIDLSATMVPVQSTGLTFTTFTLLVTVIAFLLTLSIFDWKLNLKVGITLSVVYVVFIVLASVYEIVLN